MKKLIMIVPLVLILSLLIGHQSKMAIAGQEGRELQKPSYPYDDTPCEKVDLEQLEVPEDFYLVYSEGPTHAEWGADRSVAVSADGSYSIKESNYSRDEHKEVTKVLAEGKLPADSVKRIYARVVGCKFFELKKNYWNQRVNDGKRELMRVVAQGKDHSVSTYYYKVLRFDSIYSALIREIPRSSK